MSSIFPGFEMVIICPSGPAILGKREGRLYALDEARGKLLVDYPIDGINDDYNSFATEVYKDGKSTLFSRNGEQLTAFGRHDFNWEWEEVNSTIRVTDRESGEFWVLD